MQHPMQKKLEYFLILIKQNYMEMNQNYKSQYCYCNFSDEMCHISFNLSLLTSEYDSKKAESELQDKFSSIITLVEKLISTKHTVKEINKTLSELYPSIKYCPDGIQLHEEEVIDPS